MTKFIRQCTLGLLGLLLGISVQAKLVIAIDAGHGGKDPGAIGKHLGLQEKVVTLAVAKELKALLDADPNFKAVMTRNSDYFIPLPKRTEIARKAKANYLISIHADSSPSSENLKGSSVWVLSNKRASDELGAWLEDREKQSELLGGAGAVLSNTNERYLNQTVLDLQFSHSQKAGYELGKDVLSKLANVSPLAKKNPQHASLSVLRSPDIPSILVETGFLSNASEEQRLATTAYRKQVARAIYQGLVAYANKTSRYTTPKTVYREEKNSKDTKTRKETIKSTPDKSENKAKTDNKVANETRKNDKAEKNKVINPNANYHIVAQDETLYRIALMYKTTPEKLSQLNNIKNNNIRVGQKLKVK